ncbi:MAG: hypothetical protein R3B47_19055 [Bacteroidia bacterium]
MGQQSFSRPPVPMVDVTERGSYRQTANAALNIKAWEEVLLAGLIGEDNLEIT